MGDYLFTDIGPGIYEIMVDSAGLFMKSNYLVDTRLKSLYEGYDFIIGKDSIYTDPKVISLDNAFSATEAAPILVFPVPARDRICIYGTKENDPILNVLIHDLSGRVVKAVWELQHEHYSTVDISELIEGTYVLHVYLDSGPVSKIFLKH
jgi:hypothetical protein